MLIDGHERTLIEERERKVTEFELPRNEPRLKVLQARFVGYESGLPNYAGKNRETTGCLFNLIN